MLAATQIAPGSNSTQVNATQPVISKASTNLTQSQSHGVYAWASSCLSALLHPPSTTSDYSIDATTYFSTLTYTISATTSLTPVTAYRNFTTYCDGVPRAILDGPTYISNATVFAISASLDTYLSAVSIDSPLTTSALPTPTPPCSLEPADCRVLWSSWNSFYAAYSASSARTSFLRTDPSGPIDPAWGQYCTASPTNVVTYDACCALWVKGVRLYYWPVTTTDGDLCKGNGSTVPATSTGGGPNTYHLGTTTLTSPTVYLAISYWYQNTVESCAHPLTRATDVTSTTLIPISATDISSICRLDNQHGTTKSFNYADLNSPVPWSAYQCQPYCWDTRWGSPCNPITAPYRPQLAIPTPAFDNYEFNQGCAVQPIDHSWFDPPVALAQVSEAGGPAAPAIMTTTADSSGPSSSISYSSAPATPEPAMSPSPSTPAVTPSSIKVLDQTSSAVAVIPFSDPAASGLQSTLGSVAPTSRLPLGPGEGSATVPAASTSGSGTVQPDSASRALSSHGVDPETPIPVSRTTSVNIGGLIASVLDASTHQPEETATAPPTSSGSGVPAAQVVTVVTFGQSALTIGAIDDSVVIDGTTLSPGQIVTTSGHVMSVASTALVVDGTTRAFIDPKSSTAVGVVFTAPRGGVFTAEVIAGSVVLAGQTLVSGRPTVIVASGLTVEAISTALVVDGETLRFSSLATADGTLASRLSTGGSTNSSSGSSITSSGASPSGESLHVSTAGQTPAPGASVVNVSGAGGTMASTSSSEPTVAVSTSTTSSGLLHAHASPWFWTPVALCSAIVLWLL
ncbi:hypothetical protein LTR53_004499 [Teratosphaeriaceae sp. CCFEE 6253]|nr:hypothetical protein LTR53_004499 [Teratosphaeriaceae sp. CCFEE 6253]